MAFHLDTVSKLIGELRERRRLCVFAEQLLLPNQASSSIPVSGSVAVTLSIETLQLPKSLRQELIAETASTWTDRMRSSGAEFLASTLESVMAVGDLGLLADQASWTESHLGSEGIRHGILSATS
jgi:hypothetical protein